MLNVIRHGGGSSDSHATFDALLKVIQTLSDSDGDQAPKPSTPTGSSEGADKGSTKSLNMMLKALEEEEVKALLSSQPSLVNVVGRLIPTLLTPAGCPTLAAKVSENVNFEDADSVYHKIYSSVATYCQVRWFPCVERSETLPYRA